MIDISTDFLDAGIGVDLGWIEAELVVVPSDVTLAGSLDAAVATAAAQFGDLRPQDLPAVAATRAAYKALSKDPARYRPAAEALLRRVAQGKGLYRVSNVVDVNNLLSLESGFSIGTYDAARLTPPLVFRRGRAGEVYEGIGRGVLNLEGLPVLADVAGPFGSPTSDSVPSMIVPTTTRTVMAITGFRPAMVPVALLERAQALLSAHCRARVLSAQLVAAG
jgi:DNA/RNA-binding domain of Phe-tRNA-synthetase-like protein